MFLAKIGKKYHNFSSFSAVKITVYCIGMLMYKCAPFDIGQSIIIREINSILMEENWSKKLSPNCYFSIKNHFYVQFSAKQQQCVFSSSIMFQFY